MEAMEEDPPPQPLLTSGFVRNTSYEIFGPPEQAPTIRLENRPLNYEYCITGNVSFGGNAPIQASFFLFNPEDGERAGRLVTNALLADHENVAHPLIFEYDEKIKKHIIGIRAFHGFLEDWDQSFYERGKVRGNPHPFLQKKIKELLLTFKHLSLKGLSASQLHQRGCFIWVGDSLKILWVDINFGVNQYHLQTDNQRYEIHCDLKRLSDGIRQYLLNVPGDAYFNQQKELFLEAFDHRSFYEFKRNNDLHLKMLSEHSFLEELTINILKTVADIDQAFASGDAHSDYDVDTLLTLIYGSRFVAEIVPKGGWILDTRSEAFDLFLRRDFGQRGFTYRADSLKSLIHCVRNLCSHYYNGRLYDPYGDRLAADVNYDIGMTVEKAYQEILNSWPTLIPRLHYLMGLARVV